MAVTSHLYPKALVAIMDKTVDLHADTFKAMLFTGDASAWTSTQQAYQFVSDLKTAYTEDTDAGYARVTLAGLSVAASGNKVTWTCTSPISFGNPVSITARSMAIIDTSVGSADASWLAIAIIDFGQNFVSSSGPWVYNVDGTNGLGAVTLS